MNSWNEFIGKSRKSDSQLINADVNNTKSNRIFKLS